MGQVWDPLRKKMVALSPEEKVRQWFIGVLREIVKVPVHMMMSEVALKFGEKDYRADILIYARGGAPLMIVECKRETVDLSREVLEQVLRYNLVLDVPYLAITNGRSTFLFQRVPATAPDSPAGTYVQLKSLPLWEAMQQG